MRGRRVFFQRYESIDHRRGAWQGAAAICRAGRFAAQRYPLSQAAGIECFSSHRIGHGLFDCRAGRTWATLPTAGIAIPHGRGSGGQRDCHARCRAQRDDVEDWRRCHLLRRCKKRFAAGRSGRVLSQRGGGRIFLSLQASGTTHLENAIYGRPLAGLAEKRRWLENAGRANRSAQQLERELRTIPNLEILHPRQANSVFVRIPPTATNELYRRGWSFYEFIGGGARLMCAWDTTEDDVMAIVADIRDVLGGTTK